MGISKQEMRVVFVLLAFACAAFALEMTARAKVGTMSLAELKERTMDEIRGMARLSTDDMSKAKSMFMSMIMKFKTGAIRGQSLIASRVAEDAFSKAGDHGSGLDLIFRKLNELEKKIRSEKLEEGKTMGNTNRECQKIVTDQNKIIQSSSNERGRLRGQTSASHVLITKHRATWRQSRDLEDKTHKALVDLQTARTESMEACTARVDERNRALDVMQKALFMVCERFNRFKNGKLCMKVKSQPDVNEPKRYETNPLKEAEMQDKEAHKKGSKWFINWEKQRVSDQKLEGNPNPENRVAHDPTAAAPSPPKAELGEPPHKTLPQVLAEEESDVGKWKLS